MRLPESGYEQCDGMRTIHRNTLTFPTSLASISLDSYSGTVPILLDNNSLVTWE